MTNIISYQETNTLSEIFKNKKLVVAGGCFDLLHIGHITLLENAKKEGEVLIVLLESDNAIKRKKGINRPIHNQEQRAQLVGALKAVDVVIMLSGDMTNNDYDALMQVIKPAIIATTEDDPNISHKKRQAEKIGAKVVMVNKYISSVSTTKLLEVLSKEM